MNYNKIFSKQDIINLLEIIQSAALCKNEADLKKALKKAKEAMDADCCISGLGKIGNKGLMTDILMVVNGDYPEEWINMYKAESFYTIDPVIKSHERCCAAQIWKDTFKFYTNKRTMKFLGHAGDFGLKHGISNGLFVPEARGVSIFSFAGNTDRFNAYHKNIMDVITPHLHMALVRLYKTSQ